MARHNRACYACHAVTGKGLGLVLCVMLAPAPRGLGWVLRVCRCAPLSYLPPKKFRVLDENLPPRKIRVSGIMWALVQRVSAAA